jgi:superfamily II DNA or RNA helicase
MLPASRILVAVKSRDNVQKTVATLANYLPRTTIGQRGAGKSHPGRVTVSTAASLKNCGPDWDLFLGDEAHELLADTYVADIIHQTPQAIRYGFTATVKGRSDNTDARMEAVFGRPLFYLSYPEAVGLGLVVPIEVRWQRVELERNPCTGFESDVARLRHGIWRNRARNRLIAATVRPHHEAGEQCLILVHKIEHALDLKRELPEATLCYGNLTPEDEQAYERLGLEAGKVRLVIATGVWKLGVSFNHLAVLAWAGAGSSPIDATQGPCRVSRINTHGKKVGLVYDFVDEFDNGFYNQSLARRKIYRKHDWANVEPVGAFAGKTGISKYF